MGPLGSPDWNMRSAARAGGRNRASWRSRDTAASQLPFRLGDRPNSAVDSTGHRSAWTLTRPALTGTRRTCRSVQSMCQPHQSSQQWRTTAPLAADRGAISRWRLHQRQIWDDGERENAVSGRGLNGIQPTLNTKRYGTLGARPTTQKQWPALPLSRFVKRATKGDMRRISCQTMATW